MLETIWFEVDGDYKAAIIGDPKLKKPRVSTLRKDGHGRPVVESDSAGAVLPDDSGDRTPPE